jgi:hypothetical protein
MGQNIVLLVYPAIGRELAPQNVVYEIFAKQCKITVCFCMSGDVLLATKQCDPML